MTLIIKELVIRGVVSIDHSQSEDSFLEHEDMITYLQQMRKDIEYKCLEKLEQKLERTIR